MTAITTRRLLSIALAAAVPAVAAAPADALIVPQKSIAGIAIGMTQQQVLDRLGSPAKDVTRRGGSGGDDPITTYTYRGRGLKVLFHPNRANTANVVIDVDVYRGRRQRTAEGIGIGSTRSAVARKVKGVKCRRFDPSYAVCWVGRSRHGATNTTFWLNRRNRVNEVTLAVILGD